MLQVRVQVVNKVNAWSICGPFQKRRGTKYHLDRSSRARTVLPLCKGCRQCSPLRKTEMVRPRLPTISFKDTHSDGFQT